MGGKGIIHDECLRKPSHIKLKIENWNCKTEKSHECFVICQYKKKSSLKYLDVHPYIFEV